MPMNNAIQPGQMSFQHPRKAQQGNFLIIKEMYLMGVTGRSMCVFEEQILSGLNAPIYECKVKRL